MPITLSQPAPAPTAALWQARHSTRLFTRVFRVALMFLAPLGWGCEGATSVDPTTHSPSASTDTSDANHGDRDRYDWPTDPNHPIIQIEVEGAAGLGTIEIEFFPELAPTTVAQLTQWIDEGFFDGTTFHRVIQDFMIQGGDPNTRDNNPSNDGKGGPGFTLADEFSEAPFVRGVVGMSNEGRERSAGSQFFIMHGDQPSLNGRYTVVGRVRSGIEIVDAIAGVETDSLGRWGPKARPIEDVVISRVHRIEPRFVAGLAPNPPGTSE